MKSAEAWLLRAARSLPGKLQLTSPLSQSKSGPTSSLSSAMNPSSETAAAPMIVLPMIPSLRVRGCAAALLQMHRKPRVVVIENELRAGRRAVEPELAWRDDLGARPGPQSLRLGPSVEGLERGIDVLEFLRDGSHVHGGPAARTVRVVDRDRDLRSFGEVAGVLRPWSRDPDVLAVRERGVPDRGHPGRPARVGGAEGHESVRIDDRPRDRAEIMFLRRLRRHVAADRRPERWSPPGLVAAPSRAGGCFRARRACARSSARTRPV